MENVVHRPHFTIKPICRLVAAACVAQLALTGQAWAQSSDASAVKLEKTEITGSSVKRINAEGALPVQTLSRQDIERSGAKSVPELIQNLSSMQGFTQSSISVGGGGGGFSGASIHGIGENRTLVLINGRRMATWAGQTLTGQGAAIDLNTLPVSVIERVEILTDGASALYGADAVAGVLNFILRKNSQEGNVSVDITKPKGGVGKNTNLSVSKGFGDLYGDDGWNVLLSFSREKQDKIAASDRDFSKTGIIDFDYNGESVNFFNGSSRGVPANYTYTNTDGNAVNGNYYLLKNGKCPAQHVQIGPRCIFDYAATVEIMPESERTNAMLNFSKKFGEHLFGFDYLYSDFTLTSRIAAPPVDMAILPSSALYGKYASEFVGIDKTKNIIARWRGTDAGNRTTEDRTKTHHVNLSLKGKLDANWDYEGALVFSTNEWVEKHTAGWLKQNEQDAAVANGTFDPFLSPGQQSAAGQAAIESMKHVGEYKSQVSSIARLEVKASREWNLAGWEQPISTGVGGSFGNEKTKYTPSDIAQGKGNNIAGDSAQEVPYDASRTLWGAFAELNLPFSKQLEWNNAVRVDNYSDFGTNTTFKSSMRFQPSREFLLRGSVGTGFRAPSVPEIKANVQLYGVTGAQYPCPTAALELLKKTYSTIVCPNSGDPIQYNQVASGNSELKPEKSFQFSFGFRAEPVSWLSFGADYWNVLVKDRINQIDEETVFRDPVTYAKNFTYFDDPGTKERTVALYTPNENLGEEKFAGLDVDIKAGTTLWGGKLTAQLAWSHIFRHDYQNIKGGPFYSDVGVYRDGQVIFDNIYHLTFNYRYGNAWTHTLAANMKSSYFDQSYTADDCFVSSNVTGDCIDIRRKVAAYNTFDWQTQYTGLYKGLTLTGGIINFTDRRPPLSIKTTGGHQLGYDNRYTDARGRTLYLKANYKF